MFSFCVCVCVCVSVIVLHFQVRLFCLAEYVHKSLLLVNLYSPDIFTHPEQLYFAAVMCGIYTGNTVLGNTVWAGIKSVETP